MRYAGRDWLVFLYWYSLRNGLSLRYRDRDCLRYGHRDSSVDGDSDGDRLWYGYKGRADGAVTGHGAGTAT
jgi:uncharacterized protein YfaT (DUF1175 family)